MSVRVSITATARSATSRPQQALHEEEGDGQEGDEASAATAARGCGRPRSRRARAARPVAVESGCGVGWRRTA